MVVKKKKAFFFSDVNVHMYFTGIADYLLNNVEIYSVTYCYNINFDTIQSLYLIFCTGYYIRYELFHALDIKVFRYSVTIQRKNYP